MDTERPITATGMSPGKLVLSAAVFLLLTAGIFWHQFHQIEAGAARPAWDRLRWGYLPLIVACLPVETVAAAWRMRILCRVLHPDVGLWSCVKAELANASISILTPSQTGGGPAQIYMLSRAGVGLGVSLTVSLVSFMATTVVLLLMGLYTVFVSGAAAGAPLFAAAFWTIIAVMLAMVAAALFPGLFRVALGGALRVVRLVRGGRPAPGGRLGRLARRLVELAYGYHDDARAFLARGKRSFLAACLLSAVFLFARALMPFLCLRFLGVEGATPGRTVEVQTALIFLVFFAPTPGAAGLAEAASAAFLSATVPAGLG